MSAEEQVKYLCLLLLDGLHGLASVNVGNLAIRGLECQLHMRRVSSLYSCCLLKAVQSSSFSVFLIMFVFDVL